MTNALFKNSLKKLNMYSNVYTLIDEEYEALDTNYKI